MYAPRGRTAVRPYTDTNHMGTGGEGNNREQDGMPFTLDPPVIPSPFPIFTKSLHVSYFFLKLLLYYITKIARKAYPF
jgi:hypothetical protein